MKNCIGLVLLFGCMFVCGMELRSDKVELNEKLLLAAGEGHKDVCEFWIGKGADVNVADEDGNTLLIWAAENGHKEICEILIENDADIQARNYVGKTALIGAAEEGHKDVCAVLIEKSADMHATTEGGSTALMWATASGHKDVCELLIEKGADVDAADQYGYTVLMLAAKEGHKEISGLLLRTTVLRDGTSRITVKEARDRLLTTLLVLKTFSLPSNVQWEIVSWLRDDLSILATGCDGNIDAFPEILVLAVAHNIRSFLLSEKGKSLLEEAREKAKNDLKDLFRVDAVWSFFPGSLGEALKASFNRLLEASSRRVSFN